MSKISGNPTPTDELIRRLRMMAESGGMLTKDRILTILDSADRLELYSERVAILMENAPLPQDALSFPLEVTAHEEH